MEIISRRILVYHKINLLKHECVINGDNTYINIAAASILAKVTRDRYIIDLCEKNEN